MKEALSDHHMVCKIHKNIKGSLKETIKGREPRSTSNTILSCALEASTHLHLPLLLSSSRLSPPSLCHAFPPVFLQLFICRFNHLCVSLSICTPIRSLCTCSTAGLFVVTQVMGGYQRRPFSPLERFRGEEEGEKEQAPL